MGTNFSESILVKKNHVRKTTIATLTASVLAVGHAYGQMICTYNKQTVRAGSENIPAD